MKLTIKERQERYNGLESKECEKQIKEWAENFPKPDNLEVLGCVLKLINAISH